MCSCVCVHLVSPVGLSKTPPVHSSCTFSDFLPLDEWARIWGGGCGVRKSPTGDSDTLSPSVPSLQREARDRSQEAAPRCERSRCGTQTFPHPPSFPAARQEGLQQRAVICGCAAVARGRAANPRARSQAGAGRLSPPASLAYDDLAVRKRAWEGCLSFFHFGTWGNAPWFGRCAPGGVADEGQRSGHRAGNCPSGSKGGDDVAISVPGIFCLKNSPQSRLLEHRASLVVSEGY